MKIENIYELPLFFQNLKIKKKQKIKSSKKVTVSVKVLNEPEYTPQNFPKPISKIISLNEIKINE
ncbi:hypothetical protein [Tenacibaculum sp.]|uniref:hypothetical protein n=1 Tax=Tenacibaculum sp. TaxID=1906242 RepID=UPI003AA841D1